MDQYLQYGAFGLLTIILIALGREARIYLKSADERSRLREERAHESRQRSEARFQELTEQSIVVHKDVTETLRGLCRELHRSGKIRGECDDNDEPHDEPHGPHGPHDG